MANSFAGRSPSRAISSTLASPTAQLLPLSRRGRLLLRVIEFSKATRKRQDDRSGHNRPSKRSSSSLIHANNGRVTGGKKFAFLLKGWAVVGHRELPKTVRFVTIATILQYYEYHLLCSWRRSRRDPVWRLSIPLDPEPACR